MVSAAEIASWLRIKGCRVVPCNASQLKLMKLHPNAQANIDTFPGYRDRLDQLGEAGVGWAVIGDGRVLAMIGVLIYWPGCAEAWMMVDQIGIQNRRFALTRGARRFFDKIGQAFDLRRVQIMVSVAHNEAVAWAQLLDFEFEATLKRYGPDGSDYLVFARFYD